MSSSKRILLAKDVGPTISMVDLLVPISDQQRMLLNPALKIKGVKTLAFVEKLKEEARQDGYSEGYSRGRQEGFQAAAEEGQEKAEAALSKSLGELAQDLDRLTEQMRASINYWYQTAEERMADLAVVIAERVIRTELSMSRESVLEIAKEAVQEAIHGSDIRIRINPFDSGIIESRKEELMRLAPHLRSIEIVSDPEILGGCSIETDDGVIDARIEMMIKKLVEKLQEGIH